MTTTPKQFKISDLLANAIQPFPDLDTDEQAALAASLKAPGVLKHDPVRLASAKFGYRLFDGSQRLRALQQNGRTTISEGEFKVYDNVETEDEAHFWATRFNAGRRHLSPEQRAAHALKLRNELHWSDARIAEAMNVSKMTIGRWLKGEDKLDSVVGKDGVMQPPKATKQAAPKPFIKPGSDPWQGDGYVLRSIVKVNSVLSDMLKEDGDPAKRLPSKEELGEQQFGFCQMALEELSKSVSGVLAAMKQPRPAKPKAPVTKRPAKTMADQSK